MLEPGPLLIIVLAFGAVTAAAFVLGQFLAAQAQMHRRLPAPVRSGTISLEDESSFLQSFVAKHFTEQRFGVDSTLRGKLRQELLRAGYFRSDALNYYLFARLALPAALPSAAYIALTFFFPGVAWYLKLLAVGVAVVLAIIGPDIYIDQRQRRLAVRYRELFPDFLDLLLVCINAGLSVEAALERVTGEIAKQSREFGLNLMMMAAEMRAGRSTLDAMESLADRLILDEARSLLLVMRQSIDLGSDIGNTLRLFGEEMRDKRVLRAEEKANKLPVKITLPLALFIFPVILMVLMFPVVVRFLSVLQLQP